ncbi:uncharacterized protein LOC120092810 [Benincasa hispida]|uniref:uncharacterized protein LOC120092810 n=1 Tax=Benincasa hispida TaxID=102211 RepID=UPI0019019D08|nr:uncharacterized protein LOC120092810 [Benincasa hispida]
MPFSSFSLNRFPDRKKPTPTESTATDDGLAAVKAAAWAWYQHGSGSESKPVREFGLTRPITVPKPSRYKLEASRSQSLLIEDNSQTPKLHNNSLLDSYEIASISRRLSDLLDPSDINNFRFSSFESEIMDLGRQIEGKTTKPNKFTALWRWRRRKPSLMCGKTDDVVLGTLVSPLQKQPRRPMPRRT